MAFIWKPNPYFTPNAYVSVDGNDLNDGTAQRPYRSLQKCKDAGKLYVQVASGIYREAVAGLQLFGESKFNTIIDASFIATVGTSQSFNLTFVNYTHLINGAVTYNGIISKNSQSIGTGTTSSPIGINLVIINGVFANPTTAVTILKNCTFINSSTIPLNGGVLPLGATGVYNNIYQNCSICIASDTNADFNLFYNCTFKIGSEATYTALTGATDDLKLANLRNRYSAQFPTSANTFQFSKVADPLFTNSARFDCSLNPASPARHMAYNGTFIGAFDVAYPIKPYADDLSHPDGFYLASKGANIQASNTKLSLARNADGSSVGGGQIITKPQDLSAVYELRTVLASQQIADRNREWLDTNADIDMTAPIYPGTAITVGESYVVEGGSVVYNSITYATRSKFIAVAGQTAFTSSDGGYLYLIKETPNRSTCELRFKQTLSGVTVTPGNNLTNGTWYKASGAVTWNGKVIPDGDSFQAVTGALSFTGGNCIEMFTNADTWYEVEIGDKPLCKKVGNVTSGAIDVGTDGLPLTNGHKEFYTTANQARTSFIIQARYIQYRLTFQNKMLK